MKITYKAMMAIKTLLTTPLEQEAYQLGTLPFAGDDGNREEGVHLARLLLKSLHILEIQNMGFIPKNVTAVKKLLEENFDELHNTELKNTLFEEGRILHINDGINEEQ